MTVEVRPRRLDARRYREVLGRFATGVTVVTSVATTPDGQQPIGTTVNSFTSVSLDPPLVLICVGRERSIHPVIAETRRFAVNILAEDAQDLSDCFSGAPSELPREAFCNASYRLSTAGNPVLGESIAHLDCEVEQVLEAGDHTIYLARPTEVQDDDRTAMPLLYYRGRYLRIERAEESELRGKPDA
jgi:flavin reductase (DIM6/NTAB) family NADH-FMN oxidoreductase RutF